VFCYDISKGRETVNDNLRILIVLIAMKGHSVGVRITRASEGEIVVQPFQALWVCPRNRWEKNLIRIHSSAGRAGSIGTSAIGWVFDDGVEVPCDLE
jgi:hypothetical protein